jgi:hypothetical protein
MEEPGIASAAVRPATDWGRAADGIGMAGFALFLLLNTTGVLPWSFWFDALSLWPVLLMSAGVKIAFEKSRLPMLVLLGPVMVLGTLAWLASGARPAGPLPAGSWEAESVARPAGTQSVEFEAPLAAASLRLASSDAVPADRLVDGRSASSRGASHFEVSNEGGVAHVQLLGGERHGVVFMPRASERWELALPATLPLRVRLSGAGVRADLDLASGSVEGAVVDGVFLAVAARLPAPARDTELQLKGVFNSLSLVVPDGTPVRVHGTGLPFNAVDRGVRGSGPGYDVSVQGIFSAVQVRREHRDAASRAQRPGPAEATPSPAASSKAEAEPGAPR